MKYDILVINLDSSKQRYDLVSSQLQALGLSHTRISACAGDLVNASDLELYYSINKNRNQYHKDLTRGEIGCYVSHYRCWKYMIENQLDFCIILEDDAIIKHSILDTIKLLSSLQCEWQCFKLANPFKAKPIKHRVKIKDKCLVQYKKVPAGTQAYALHAQAANALLNTTLPFGRPADIDFQYYWEKNLSIFGIVPYDVTENQELKSNINSTFDRKKVKRRRIHSLMQKIRFLYFNTFMKPGIPLSNFGQTESLESWHHDKDG